MSLAKRFLAVAVVLALTPAATSTKEEPGAGLFEVSFAKLFTIRRSTNENELVYEARMRPDGFDTEKPIYVYWVMKAEGGKTEPLTAFERSWAYGVNVQHAARDSVVFSLTALPQRSITVQRHAEAVRATMELDGEPCELLDIFIQTKGGGLIPTIQHIDARGRSLATGKPIEERIVEKK